MVSGMARMTIDDKLGADKFVPDERRSHIQVQKQCADGEKTDQIIRVCPAGLYKGQAGDLRFDYLGCLECGTCRVLGLGSVVEQWEYPDGSFGVQFRQS